MSEFKITMHKAPGISEEECRRRIHRAYQILIDAARRAREQKIGPGEVGQSENRTNKEDSDE